MTDVASREDADIHAHRVIVQRPSTAPSGKACDWSLITRPIAPNAIAADVIEIRHNETVDDAQPSFSVWIDGECIRDDIAVGAGCSILIEPPIS